MKLLSISYKTKVALITFGLLAQVFLFDYLIFEKILFNIPNEMEWDTSHWYNFAYARSQLKNPVDGKKVIITGSSVALYSVLPEELLKQTNQKVHSSFYSHVALAPTDLYYYKDDIASAKPNLVVYLLNFADLQWEYVTVKNNEFEFNHALWLAEYSDRYPARTYYPSLFLKDYFFELNKKQISRLASKSLLYVNRYRHFAFDPIETWLDNHTRSGRSFQKYNGSLPKEGIWSKGWTGQTATLHCSFNKKQEDSVFILNPNTTLKVTVFADSPLFENEKLSNQTQIATTQLKFDKSGWNPFPWEKISEISKIDSAMIRIEVLEGMGTAIEANLYHYGLDYPVGVRLSHYFCKDPVFINKSYIRDSYLDEKRFSEMDSKTYDKDYYLRILDQSENRAELGRLNTLRKKKSEVRNLPFKPWFEYNQILKISNYFKEKNIPFIIVLSPENPIESVAYTNDRWYKEMVLNLRNFVLQNGQNLYEHTNSIIEKQLFFDPHHLTYDGAKLFNPFIEKIIQKELSGASK